MTKAKKRLLTAIVALLIVPSAHAFAPLLIMGGIWAAQLAQYVVVPSAYGISCAFAYSPPIRIFGTERAVYGLDWGSLACHAQNVYGLQLSFVGGSVEEDIYGLQLGIFATGYAQQDLPFSKYHFFDIDHCHMNGIQFGTFAAKTAMANGFQMSACYAEAQMVNGFQVALVNNCGCLHGLQVGFLNMAKGGLGLQVGVLNCTRDGLSPFLPVLNFVY